MLGNYLEHFERIGAAKAEDGDLWQTWYEMRDWFRPIALSTITSCVVIGKLISDLNWNREYLRRKIIGWGIHFFKPEAEVLVTEVNSREEIMEASRRIFGMIEAGGDAEGDGGNVVALKWREEKEEIPQKEEERTEVKIEMEAPVESPWAPKRRRKHVTFAEEIVEVKYFKPESPKKWLLRNTSQRRLSLQGMSEEELEDKETVMRGSPKSTERRKGQKTRSPAAASGGEGRRESSLSGKGRKRLVKSPAAS